MDTYPKGWEDYHLLGGKYMSEAETTGPLPEDGRVLLVILDDNDEMPIALHFACRRAEHSDGRVALFDVPDKADSPSFGWRLAT